MNQNPAQKPTEQVISAKAEGLTSGVVTITFSVGDVLARFMPNSTQGWDDLSALAQRHFAEDYASEVFLKKHNEQPQWVDVSTVSNQTMTQAEYDAKTEKLKSLIAAEDAGKKDPSKSLEEKIAHNRERNRLQEALRQHKLNYFQLVVDRPTGNHPSMFQGNPSDALLDPGFRAQLQGLKTLSAILDGKEPTKIVLSIDAPEIQSTNAQNQLGLKPDAEGAQLFFAELLGSVETLGGIAEQYGVRTLTDLMYLQQAILKGETIEVWPGETSVGKVVQVLPSANRWLQYTELGGEWKQACERVHSQ